jgi:glycine/D-amino acid oxidase-like deaminating enzyme/nitrite reductase/ring-hydroxylating ferredoxin subunit
MHTNQGQKCEHCDCEKKELQGRAAGASLWAATVQAPSYPSLPGDTQVDVAIVGGGITGLTTAYLLQKAGKKVAVIEANALGQGVTGYTSAHLTFVLDSKFYQLIKKFGLSRARLMQQSNQAALDTIRDIIQSEHIDCDWAATDGYLYTESSEDDEVIRKEVTAARDLGIDASYTTEVPLPFPTYSGVRFSGQAVFHPLKYVYALAKIIAGRGGQVFEHTRVTDLKDGCVITDKGKVKAADVVLATHAPLFSQLLTVQAKTAPYRSYIIGFKAAQEHPAPGLFWDTDEPYQYIRSYATQAGQVVVVGGKDHPAGKPVDTRRYTGALEKYARQRFMVESVDYAWSAQYFRPVDDLPYIGRAPFRKHLYVATGYSGNGLTFGTVAALLISDLIQNKRSAWAKLYSPNRVSLAGLGRLMQYGWNNFNHVVVDRFKKGAATSAKGLDNEQGMVVTEGGKKIALYKDAQGNVTKLSPVCTHAGCIVQWNSFEKTWDCPCHGGRYTSFGKVINGPPVKDLANIS